VDARDPAKLSQWSHGCRDYFSLHHENRRGTWLDLGTKFAALAGGSLEPWEVRNRVQSGCNCRFQVRRVSSTVWPSSPRKIERYSGRLADRDFSPRLAERQAKFDENFKNLPVAKVKKPQAEYRQGIVDNSTKNMALVPKKWKRALPTKEVLDAVLFLRRAKGSRDAVKEVVRKRITRMLKLEMMLVLSELQRLDECYLAHQVSIRTSRLSKFGLTLIVLGFRV
jgi:hypothetical protein